MPRLHGTGSFFLLRLHKIPKSRDRYCFRFALSYSQFFESILYNCAVCLQTFKVGRSTDHCLAWSPDLFSHHVTI